MKQTCIFFLILTKKHFLPAQKVSPLSFEIAYLFIAKNYLLQVNHHLLITKLCHIQTFFWHTVFLKLVCGWFSDTQGPPTEGPRVQYFTFQGNHVCALSKRFVSEMFLDYVKYFYSKCAWEKCRKKLFWAKFFVTSIPFKRFRVYLNLFVYFHGHLLLILSRSKGFQKLIFFLKENSNFKRLYLQNFNHLVKKKTSCLQNALILGARMSRETTAGPLKPLFGTAMPCGRLRVSAEGLERFNIHQIASFQLKSASISRTS